MKSREEDHEDRQRKKPGPIARLAEFFDRLSEDARAVSFFFVMLGICISLLSYVLGLHEIVWNGRVDGLTITGVPEGFAKQVGFMYAPNWAFASIVVTPLAIYFILKAKQNVESVIKHLIASDMILKIDGSPLDVERLYREWDRHSVIWFKFGLAVVTISTLFTIFGDFVPVVFQWLWNADDIAVVTSRIGEEVPLNDSTYEFDWSIAATFDGMGYLKWPNIVFSTLAYLIVPILGTGLILLHFIWFIALAEFISPERLERQGVVIVPDINSKDRNDRAGFEKFEPLFDDLLLASLALSVLALFMHLQNIFLRAPQYNSFLDMIFTDGMKRFARVLQGDESIRLDEILDYLNPVNQALAIDAGAITIQTYLAGLGTIIVAVFVLFWIWRALRQTALNGRDYLLSLETLSQPEERQLERMQIWPVGWISLNRSASLLALILISMLFLNVVPIAIAWFTYALVIRSVKRN